MVVLWPTCTTEVLGSELRLSAFTYLRSSESTTLLIVLLRAAKVRRDLWVIPSHCST